MLKFITAIGVALVSLAGIVGALLGLFLLSTPRPTDIKDCLTTKMFQVRLCPTEPGYVKLKDISLAARNAVIVSEDGSFYGHKGFDWAELRMSFEMNLEKGQYARGGSTITQQLAKNVYLTPEKSLLRKVKEALITIQLEKMLTKDEILEKYLNVVEFGPKIFGISKASRHYFGKSPAALTAAEGAFLAFLLPNPTQYSVSHRKKQLTPFARRQVREIITRLYRFKKIGEADYYAALSQANVLFGGTALAEPAPGEGLSPSEEEMSEAIEPGPLESPAAHDAPAEASEMNPDTI